MFIYACHLCSAFIVLSIRFFNRHSNEMIKKLETAGLGFSVKETEKLQKLGECVLYFKYPTWLLRMPLCLHLGKIPLRQLVYRVLDIPPSMRSLVYHFGQLDSETEHQYIQNIVNYHVSLRVSVQKGKIYPKQNLIISVHIRNTHSLVVCLVISEFEMRFLCTSLHLCYECITYGIQLCH